MTRDQVTRDTVVRLVLWGAFFTFALLVSGGKSVAQTGMNPCAAAPGNPCAAAAAEMGIKTSLFTRPQGTMLAKGDQAALVKEGERLFKDKDLSTNGYSCNTCHASYGMYNETFAKPYPHKVVMAEDNGVKQIRLDEMIQLCLLAAMETKPLPWNSRKLAALTAYTAKLQKGFIAQEKAQNKTMSPRSAMNPCAAQ